MKIRKNSVNILFSFFIILVIIFSTMNFLVASEKMDICSSTAAELSKSIDLELTVGGNKDSIEEFLKKHNIKYSYDRFAGRFQGIIRSEERGWNIDCAVVAYIYVDNEGRYLKSEFVASYAGL